MNLLWQNVCAIIQKFIVVNGQILKEFITHLVTLINTKRKMSRTYSQSGVVGAVGACGSRAVGCSGWCDEADMSSMFSTSAAAVDSIMIMGRSDAEEYDDDDGVLHAKAVRKINLETTT